MLTDRFAFCQSMPVDEFVTVAEAVRPAAYRPTRFRPYADGKTLLAAVVWTRDGRPWRMAHDRSAAEVSQIDERNRKEGYLAVDAAGYLAVGGDQAKTASRFAALWRKEPGRTMTLAWSWRRPPPSSRSLRHNGRKQGLSPWHCMPGGSRMALSATPASGTSPRAEARTRLRSRTAFRKRMSLVPSPSSLAP